MKNLYKLLVVGLLVLVGPIVVNAQACVSHNSKKCISDIVYWYNSCGALEDIAQNCGASNQVCQNAQCVNKVVTTPPPTPSPTPTPSPASNPSPSPNTDSNQNQNPQQGQGLVISMFAKKSGSSDWQHNLNVNSNDNVDFLIVVKNTLNNPINGVLVRTDLTNNISYTGNLKIGDTASAGNVTSGLDLGTLAAKASQVISFTGSMASNLPQGIVQVNTTVNSGNIMSDSDYVITNINAPVAEIIATTTPSNPTFVDKLKNFWYIWIIIIAVLAIALFLAISRKSAA